MSPEHLVPLVERARRGDHAAFACLVRATQAMAYAVAVQVLRDPSLAQDAVQDAYVRAFRNLADLCEPGAFAAWLRRITITVAMNLRRTRRLTLLRLDDVPEVPVLDEAETTWSELQRQRLAAALLTLTPSERQLCDRRYYGGWSTTRLAKATGVTATTLRKRLQRIREKLRKEIEMSEQRDLRPEDIPSDLPAKVAELLARPRLTDLPENPVGSVLELLRESYADFTQTDVPEIVDFAAARESIGANALYLDAHELHRVDHNRILRYDLTLPLLLTVRYEGQPLRLWAAGKVYRAGKLDGTHLEAFHQAELLWLDRREQLDPWHISGQILKSMHRLLPERAVKIVPTHYPMCSQAWELEVEDDGQWSEVLAWGVFTDEIVRHVGGDPSLHAAIGVGHGLDRLAMLRYGIDDIRKVDQIRVA